MAKYSCNSLDAVFSALADGTRRGMLETLSHGESSVSQFAAQFGVSLPTIHKHLHVLERAGFIAHEKRARVRHIRLSPPRRRKCRGRLRLHLAPIHEITDWITQFESHWDTHLLRLKQQVESDL